MHHLNGFIEVVDVKGMETEAFKIKRKLFKKHKNEGEISRWLLTMKKKALGYSRKFDSAQIEITNFYIIFS
ncbi:MAG: DUF1064 domain-containing protein [Bacillota bacterium]|nr:DUF1064 domain-containing protein [Bacillota bacterium]